MSPVIFPERPDGNLEFIKKIDAALWALPGLVCLVY